MVSGGTDNHLILIDLTNRNITGKDAQEILDKVGISTNKNTVPNEKLSPFITSGIRIGTAAVTSRGFNDSEMKAIASIMNQVLDKKFIKNADLELIEDIREMHIERFGSFSVLNL